LGNPPYVSAMDLKKIVSEQEYSFLKKKFITAKGTVDLYIYFFEKGLDILKEQGTLAYISPNRYLSASYGQALREFIFNSSKLKIIVDYSDVKVFANASTYPILTFLNKERSKQYDIIIGKANASTNLLSFKTVSSEKLNLVESYLWGFLLNSKISITEKLISKSIPITQVCKINATSTAAEADEYHSLINEKTGYKLINTGTIDRYKTTWGRELMVDKGTKFLKPFLPFDSKKISKNRYQLYSSPKIILAKIALRSEGFLDENGTYASVNTNCIHSFAKDISPKFVLAWINSKAFQFMFECFFDGLKMQGGYLLYSAPNLSSLYIKNAAKQDQDEIAKLVENLTHSIDKEQAKAISLEKEIDKYFYHIYDLTKEEIEIIEDSI
jgi:hypothetical protein